MKLTKTKRQYMMRFLGIIMALMFLPLAVQAIPISSPNDLDSGKSVIDFESFSLGEPAPITIAGVTISSSGTASVVDFGFIQNPGVYEGKSLGFGEFDYSVVFDSPVAQFGMGIFDPNFANNALVAFDSFGNELERIASVPTFGVGIGGSTFVGFVRPANDITRIDFLHAPRDLVGIDSISYFVTPVSTPVPEPYTMLLLGSGLVGLVGYGYCRRKQIV